MECRFEIKIKRHVFPGAFHCLANYGYTGYMNIWLHNQFDPCINCEYKIEGKYTFVEKEMSRDEFWKLSEKRIRAKDWKEFKKRGLIGN